MTEDLNAGQLTVEELRELIPQLQQLTEKYKRSEHIQRALFDISELAGSISELSRLYVAIHEIIGQFMNAQNFFVALYEKDDEFVEFPYFVDQFDESVIKQIPAKDLLGGIAGYILKSGQHLVLTEENFEKESKERNFKAIGKTPVDLIGVPLKRGNRVIGAMVVQSYDKAVRYVKDELDLLLFVSQHIVNALDRVKSRELTEQTIRERTKQLREINDELQEEILERQKVESLQQALFEISEIAASVEGEMSDFYASLHDILARLLSAPNCYVAIIDEKQSSLEFPYYSDEINDVVNSRPLSNGLTEFVLRSGKAELIDPDRVNDLAAQNELDQKTADNMLKHTNSWIGSPLYVDGVISGVIAVQTYGKDSKYTLKDLELLKFVSHHIAVAIERKRAAESIQKYNMQLSRKVRERTDELHQTNLYLKKQIEERKDIELKLIHDAHHDALTNLPNRVMFNSRLELAVANKNRYPEHQFAVLFIDLDRFKQINDSLGHHAGDMFLVEVAKRISKCIRAHDLLARLGGDEFVILLDSFDDFNDVEEVANRIIQTLAIPFQFDNKEMYSGASIGIANIEQGYKTADELIRDADAAMYQAKALGRGRFVLFDTSMRQKLLEELELENEFRKTLNNQHFDSQVQAIVNFQTNRILYHEFFVRWIHPTIGKIKREQFWKVAQSSGLTVEIDNFMLDQAIKVLQHWRTLGESEATQKIAINLSISHLSQSRLVNQIIERVKSAQIDPSNLVFEFDENELNHRSQFMLPAIKKLKRSGVILVLDNFGSGLASLSYLYSYPFDYVKIDHKFVKSITRSKRNYNLIRSVLAISSQLSFKLIAEGIENEDQYNALVEAGCTLGQGHYIQSPISMTAILAQDSLPTR
ncbi:bifunctional diguanylate cyclase/phosphodiesterase [Aliiglaciecola lipolytica]|uniref:bifunctional diguanylate cyclase/phosphodiesterase n=1 Tax=Aliiglaciecola lipolytica TaxID=477689 RepID=UPI001C0808A9|nr:EAL domain-containing protein [Aliiglaciecola lipolytica]MBU2879074.1 EAL domain-containing protein [Aliiglaciecola lipolytica]